MGRASKKRNLLAQLELALGGDDSLALGGVLDAIVAAPDARCVPLLRTAIAARDGEYPMLAQWTEALFAAGGDAEIPLLLAHSDDLFWPPASFVARFEREPSLLDAMLGDASALVGALRVLSLASLEIRKARLAVLEDALDSEEPAVRSAVMAAFTELSPTERGIARLCALLSRCDDALDSLAIDALGKLAQRDDVHAALTRYVAQGGAHAAHAIAALARVDVPTLSAALASKKRDTRLAAVNAVARFDERSLASLLADRAREDRHEAVRTAAESVLERWGVPFRDPVRVDGREVSGWLLSPLGDERKEVVTLDGTSVMMTMRLVSRDDEGGTTWLAILPLTDDELRGSAWDRAWQVVYRRKDDEPRNGYRLVSMAPASGHDEVVAAMRAPWAPTPYPALAPDVFSSPAFWEAYFDGFALASSQLPELSLDDEPSSEDAALLALVADEAAFLAMRERLFRFSDMQRLRDAAVLPPLDAEEEALREKYGRYMPAHQLYWGRIRASNVRFRIDYREGFALVITIDVTGTALDLVHPDVNESIPLGHHDPHARMPALSAEEWEALGDREARMQGVLAPHVHRLLLAPFAMGTLKQPSHRVTLESALREAKLGERMIATVADAWMRPWKGRFYEDPKLGVVNTFHNSRRFEEELRKTPRIARQIAAFFESA